jgi:hypothetical protein
MYAQVSPPIGEDFVVAFHPENYVIFRGSDPNALRKVCRQLRWEIVSDTASASVAERAGVITEQVAAAEEKGSTQ